MNIRSIYQGARNGTAVALGVAGLFGASFAVTSLVASAAEEQQQAPATDAPAAPNVEAQTPPPRPPADRSAPGRGSQRPGRPAFKDMDTNGDGSISQQEFEAFRPAGPPPPDFDRGERYREEGRNFDPRDRGPGPRGPRGDFRDDRFGGPEDSYGPPPPPDDRYGRGRGDDRYGPPRPPRGGDFGRFDERGRGPDCEHEGAPREDDFRGPHPHGGPGEYGPPPRGPRDGYQPGRERRGPPPPPERPGEV